MTDRVVSGSGNSYNSGGLTQLDVYQMKNAMMPIGSIVAWFGGYVGDTANGGFVNVLANTIATVNAYIGPNWKVCDGSIPNDINSPIWNNGSRRLPRLDDSRFLMGTSAIPGAAGAGNNSADHNHTFTGSAVAIKGTFGAGGSYTPAGTNAVRDLKHSHTAQSHQHGMRHMHQWMYYSDSGAKLSILTNGNTAYNQTTTFVHTTAGITTAGGAANNSDNNVDGFEGFGNNNTFYTTNALTSAGSARANTDFAGGLSVSYPTFLEPGETMDHTHGFTGTAKAFTDWLAGGNYTPSGTVVTQTVNNRPLYLNCFYIIRIK